jgi:hypothetical protein
MAGLMARIIHTLTNTVVPAWIRLRALTGAGNQTARMRLAQYFTVIDTAYIPVNWTPAIPAGATAICTYNPK